MSNPKYEKVIRDLARKQGIRDAKPRFLLCFEDSKSAPQYFKAYRSHHKLTSESFIIDFDSSVSDPHSVIKRAIERKAYLVSNDEFVIEDGDQVWAIVDVDRHETMNDARQRARDNNIYLAISNPCFEYWILLHYEDTAKQVKDCSELIQKYLKKYLPKYDKGATDFSETVKNVSEASKRAKIQYINKAEPDPVKCCPCTQIYELINKIQKHIG